MTSVNALAAVRPNVTPASAATLVDLLRLRADESPDATAFVFLEDGERDELRITYGELDQRARAVAAMLSDAGVAPGDRVVMVYPPGLEYIIGFFGCLYANAIAVPAYPPDPTRLLRTLPRLQAIVNDAEATAALTTEAIGSITRSLFGSARDLARLRWLASDVPVEGAREAWRAPGSRADSVAFLQYTSGSTGLPRGVMLTHANLLHNSRQISMAFAHPPGSMAVIWLPPYHDMGLIGGILQPIYAGFPVVLMSPLAFLQRPMRWLEAMSRYRATTSGGPNFAYDLCVRKSTPEQRAALDLSNWRLAFTGAEPVRAATLDNFAAAFGSAGFRREAFYPCYGLAEGTLIVAGGTSGGGPVVRSFRRVELELGRAVYAEPDASHATTLVSSGHALMDQSILVVDPQSCAPCQPGVVGEIWVTGPSVARGYWHNLEASERTFAGRLEGSGAGPYLRTADLGFVLDGELFVTGRIKDLIIIRGRNRYPQDIELSIEASHPALRPGCSAAFAVEVEGSERLVLVCEFERRFRGDRRKDTGRDAPTERRQPDVEAQSSVAAIASDEQLLADANAAPDYAVAAANVRQALAEQHEVQAWAIVLIKPGTIPKTSSGKVQRHACRTQFQSGTLEVLWTWAATTGARSGSTRQDPRHETLSAMDEASITTWLVREFAELARVDAASIDPTDAITRHGLDSLQSVELQNRIEESLGVAMPMSSLLQGPTFEALARRLVSEAREASDATAPAIVPRDDASSDAPLSHDQRRMWFVDQVESAPIYNVPMAARVRGVLDAQAWSRAFDEIVRRHAIWRTTYVQLDGRPMQRVGAASTNGVAWADLTDLPAAQREGVALERAAAEALQPFDLTRGPVLRATMYRLAPDDHLFALHVHHIAVDGWSTGVLITELDALYAAFRRGESSPLPEPRLQYGDFAAWQAAQPDVPESHLAYWRARLGDAPPTRALPSDLGGVDGVAGYAGAATTRVLPTALSSALRDLCAAEGVTSFVVLLTAFKLLLARTTGQFDVSVGAPIATRSRRELEPLVGLFVNTLVLRTDLSGRVTFRDALTRVRETVLDAFKHQAVPFDRLVEALRPDRSAPTTPLFDVLFNYLVHAAGADVPVDDLRVQVVELPDPLARFALTLYVEPRDSTYALRLVYQRARFSARRIDVLLEQFEQLLGELVATPDRAAGEASLVTPATRALLPDPHAVLDAPAYEPVTVAFARWAARRPDARAIEQGNRAWTYGAMSARIDALANGLAARGVRPRAVVAVLGPRGFGVVASMLAVLVRGAVILPLDPRLPDERKRLMLRAARATHVVRVAGVASDASWLSALPDLHVVDVDDEARTNDEASVGEPPPVIAPDDPAYVFFTSGTTGVPKGVLGRHAGLGHFLAWQRDTFGIAPGDRAAQLTALSFDVLMRDVFTALASGATLCVPASEDDESPDGVVAWLARERITMLHTVPTLAEAWLAGAPAGGDALPSLRLAFFAGEPLRHTLVERWRATLGHGCLVVNLYGPTETTLAKCFYRVPDPPDAGVQPVGEAMPHAQALVLNADGVPGGIGEPGEIVIRTPFRSLGYLVAADNTERFVPNPFRPDAPDDLLYRTGDLGRWRIDGRLEILARIDNQVKIRGVRVEPEEVAAVLARHPSVGSCAVIARTAADGRLGLVAYLVPVAPDAELVASVRAHAAAHLPAVMVPGAFVLLDRLPTTPNGKVDRRALPDPGDAALASTMAMVAPRNGPEEVIAGIWRDVLGVADVGVETSFFELGGHSLMATQVMARVREAFRVDLPLKSLFDTPTVAGIAASVAALRHTHVEYAPLPTLVADVASRNEPFALTDVQQAYWIGRQGGFELGNVSTHRYVELEALHLDVERLNRAWQALIARHDTLRTIVQGDGLQRALGHVAPLEIETLDLRAHEPAVAERELRAVRDQMSHQVLRADRWPLFEVRATLLDARTTRLHLSLDALLIDASSRMIVARELVEFYLDPEWRPDPIDVTFRDYVLAIRTLRTTPRYARDRAYWWDRLPTLPPAPSLPLARDPTTVTQPHFVRHSGRLEADTWRRLRARASRAGLTPSGVLLAAFAEVLGAWSASPRLTLNLTLFNRLPLHPRIDRVVGDFTSLTLLAVDPPADASFETRARRVQEQLWTDLDHGLVSGVEVLREIARRRGGVDGALMPVVFTSTLGLPAADRASTMINTLGRVVYSISQTPQVWLDHQVSEDQGALVFDWDAVEALFPAGFLQSMFAAYVRLLDRLASDETAWRGQPLDLVADEDLVTRREANATRAPVSDALLHTLGAAHAATHPERPAVIAADVTLSYGELFARAGSLARRLRAAGVRPGVLVGVVMQKGWEQVVAVLGVLRTGAAYVPIDPRLPTERLHHVIHHAEARVVVTQSALDASLSWPADVVRVRVDRSDAFAPSDAAPEPVQPKPDDLAYVIYTSGSTGLPKGVMIDHRGAVNTVLDVDRRFAVGPEDRVLALSSLSFDLSVYDVFGTLAAGGAVVVPDPARAQDPAHQAELVARHGVTIWNSVPALAGLLCDYAATTGRAASLDSLRLVMMSGDWIPVALPDRLRAVARRARCVSLGGATEASIWSILYPIERVEAAWRSIPYGRPMANQAFHVLDDAMRPSPTWVPGALYIAGIGLALGYWRDEAKTAASFVTHPVTHERLYRTGDRGRYLPDGTLEFLGRDDLQVKVQGYRIELGEIDTALRQHPDVRDGLAYVVGDPRGEKRLVACIVAHEDRAVAPDEVRAFLRRKLPEYMVPGVVIVLDALPLSANGKVDRAALPDPTVAPVHRVEGPGSELDARVAAMAARVLKLEALSPDADLLAYGANSLDIIRLVNLLEAEFGVRPPLGQLYRAATVRGIAAVFAALGGAARTASTKRSEPPPPMSTDGVLRDQSDRTAFKQRLLDARRAPPRGAYLELPRVTDAAPALDPAERRSHRAFAHTPVTPVSLARLLRVLREETRQGTSRYLYASAGGLYAVETYLWLRPGAVAGLEGGIHRHRAAQGGLESVTPGAVIDRAIHEPFTNRPTFDRAAFALFLVADLAALEPMYGARALHFATLEAGAMSQLLELTAPSASLGLCQIGSIDFDAVRSLFALRERQVLVHSLLGGPIDAAVRDAWTPVEEAHDERATDDDEREEGEA